MSQMLNYLHLDSVSDRGVDWGTLAVYVCEDNCDLGKPYKKEWIWKQDFSGKNIWVFSIQFIAYDEYHELQLFQIVFNHFPLHNKLNIFIKLISSNWIFFKCKNYNSS